MVSKGQQRNSYNYNVNQKSTNQSSYHHTPNIAYKQRLQPQDVSGGLIFNNL